ncbi:4-(cytidine 5'-diphospho)-2-C-methyl-D-erythritol kinase [Erysipelotrichaceae bacterium OH741_COT-311]|nr:4-(cytidine 5'-diphospho)-2-C-methyl-D-erythritol kinase [Erysipelotrichaceae bacterium OH741_COT-311]
MKDRAYAKVNLVLEVVNRLENGYHELNMIMAPLNFYDVVDIEFASVTTIESNAVYLPVDQRNTVIKAIELLRAKYQFQQQFKIKITKHIPTQAGLAGGSSDAASTIRILNKLLRLNMSLQDMLDIGKQVGADVPFCILNQPAVVRGIGEVLQPFELECDFWLVLVKPRKGVSTKLAFEALEGKDMVGGHVDEMKKALQSDDYPSVIANLFNTLEKPSIAMVPEIADIKDKLLAMGFEGALMSGSGSTVFGITRQEALANQASATLKQYDYFTRKVQLLKK